MQRSAAKQKRKHRASAVSTQATGRRPSRPTASASPLVRGGIQSSANPSFPIVGVGASAGGLEAFTHLLEHLPSDTGFGFVLVQHLDPQHESALAQLLARSTSMPVTQATNNLPVQPNHVYIIPPGADLTIGRGVLYLKPRQHTRSPTRSIDCFFESLAHDQREHAIGVILSGTASDGTLGLEAIKAEGGIAFAQDDSAKYDSMPRSAVAAGCVDLVLKPEDIARELVRIAKHPLVASASLPSARRLHSEAEREAAAQGEAPEAALASANDGRLRTAVKQARDKAHPQQDQASGGADDSFKTILVLLRNNYAVDFSLYKPNTVQRRITRRMVLGKHNTMLDYARFLRGKPKELDALYSDCLISVTSFFRNPEAFEILKRKVFPALMQQREEEPLRVWVLGCSTGQEAYSIAMAYMEAADKTPRPRKLQIFATDLNEALLDKARHGFYTKNLTQDISPERLQRFFVEEKGGYRISKPLRESVVFARQNLLNDPPFSRIDLVSCRNLLIYLEPGLHHKALPTFHYALQPGGFLFLGSSESIGSFTDLFEPVDKKHRIYSRKAAPTPDFRLPMNKAPGRRPSVSPPSLRLPQIPPGEDQPKGLRGELSAEREADRIAVSRFSPPGVLINADQQILQFRGSTHPYLQPPPSGKATFDLLKMAREGLMLPLRAAINKAKKENRPVRRETVALQENGQTRIVNVEVLPLTNLRERCFLVLFEEAATPARNPGASPSDQPGTQRHPLPAPGKRESARVAALRRELSETRDYLHSVQEQHETGSEELQASHEELQSANEELQSLNEELETSKEELQSSNEELTTVNEEMSKRNAELNRLNTDLTNLQISTKLAIVLLGRDLTIRRFSTRAEEQFNILATDIGRPFTDLRHNLNLPDLQSLLSDTVANVREHDREVQDADGHWFSLGVRPYLTVENKVDGAVLVLVDIDALKRAEKKATQANIYARAVIDDSPPLLVLDNQLRVLSSNLSFYNHFKVSAAQTENVLVYDLGNGQWNIPELRSFLEDILPRKSFFRNFDIVHDFESIGRRTMRLSGHRLDHLQQILLFIEDITEKIQSEEKLRASELRYRRLFESAEDGILIVNPETRKVTDANPGVVRMLGFTRGQLIGKELWELGLLKDERANKAAFLELKKKHSIRYDDLPLKTSDGHTIQAEFVSNLYQENNKPVIQCNIRDITKRKRGEEELRAARSQLADHATQLEQLVAERTGRLQETIDELEHFSYTITHDMRAPLRSMQGFAALLGRKLGDQLRPDLRDYLRRIIEGADRMDALIQDSLQYARTIRENIPLTPVDPAPVLRGILESYPSLQPPHVQIEVVEPLPCILANAAGLSQCFSNLLANAIKFVKPGVTPNIRIWAETPAENPSSPTVNPQPSTQFVRFWFEDNGIGVPAEYQDRIFRMFQQLDKSYEGTGIGLALVRKTAERMGGHAGVHSEPGKGSRFWLEFKPA